MRWRRTAHDWSLIFSAAVGTYLLSVVVATRLSLWLVAAAQSWSSPAARFVLGFLALDLSKLPGLLLAAAVIGASLQTRPSVAAGGLVLLTYLFEGVVAALLSQAAWLFAEPLVLLCRLAAAGGLAWVTMLLLRSRKRPPPDSASPPRAPASSEPPRPGSDPRGGE